MKKKLSDMRKQKSGLDTHMGSACSKVAFGWAKKSFGNRQKRAGRLLPTVDGGYSSLLDISGVRIGMSSDGIGTKIEIAERVQKYDSLGYDLIAMTMDDLICNGFEPAFLSNILDVDVLDKNIINELMQGLYQAAKFSNTIITGGEIAELGSRISGYGRKMHFNWCATGVGVLHKSLKAPLTGKEIKPGDAIVSLYNPGFRSNGFSLLRKILSGKFGDKWHSKKIQGIPLTWGEAALTPCLIYSPLISGLLDAGISFHGIAHITGGGIVDNLGRLLKINKLGAGLTNLFPPDEFISKAMALGNISCEFAYRYWNMGNGMMLILPQEDAKTAVTRINRKKNYKARIAGVVTEEPIITIRNNGNTYTYTSFENK